MLSFPYWLVFDVIASLGASARTTISKQVPTGLDFIAQAAVAWGTPNTGTADQDYRNFTLLFSTQKTGAWSNQGVLAHLICGDGRNSGYMLSETRIEGGNTITCEVVNAAASPTYTLINLVLCGRAEKKAA